MILHEPEILRQGEDAIAWAKIECAQKRANFPKTLWFRVPERYARFLSTNSDAFLLAALQAAMHFGEALQVRGFVSPRLGLQGTNGGS